MEACYVLESLFFAFFKEKFILRNVPFNLCPFSPQSQLEFVRVFGPFKISRYHPTPNRLYRAPRPTLFKPDHRTRRQTRRVTTPKSHFARTTQRRASVYVSCFRILSRYLPGADLKLFNFYFVFNRFDAPSSSKLEIYLHTY